MNLKTIKGFGLMAMFAAVMLTACDKREQNKIYPPGYTDNLLTVAEKQGNMTIFVSAMKRAQMDADFAKLGNYTFLIPTDSAFTAAGITSATVNSLPLDALRTILRNHIISGRVRAIDLQLGPNAAYGTIGRDSVFTSTYSGLTYFNGKGVRQLDIYGNNGVIHALKGVLIPAGANLTTTLALDPEYSFLVAAINAAGLAATVNAVTPRLTVFAPTNAAFIAAGFPDIASINAANPVTLSNIVRYHCIYRRLYAVDITAGSFTTLQGTNVTITTAGGVKLRGTSNTTDASVTAVDMQYRNGIIHKINTVLLP
jgi:uncharacterized surface protein with fasciclin (FAS1) repeats